MSDLKQRLVRAAERGVKKALEEVFTISQRGVPVDKGTLKKSGQPPRRIPGGYEVAYRAPYARFVEFGSPEHWQSVRRHYVKAHSRKRFWGRRLTPKRYISVRSHWRGPFRRHMKERPGRFFLRAALEQVRPKLGRYVGQELQREFSRRR